MVLPNSRAILSDIGGIGKRVRKLPLLSGRVRVCLGEKRVSLPRLPATGIPVFGPRTRTAEPESQEEEPGDYRPRDALSTLQAVKHFEERGGDPLGGTRRDRSELPHQALPVHGAELVQSHLPTFSLEAYRHSCREAHPAGPEAAGLVQGDRTGVVARRDGQRFESATWLHKAQSLSKEQFKAEVERELTGRESEPSELIYFKVYKSQAPVIEQAIDTAALMLGSDKSRGYCLEMICADFLAGAHLEDADPRILLSSTLRLFQFLPGEQRQEFLRRAAEAA